MLPRRLRCVIVATHPIQYNTPWMKALGSGSDLEAIVYYCSLGNASEQGAAGYGKGFEWDVDLLAGYRWRVLENRAFRPSIHGFWGLSTPGIDESLMEDDPDAVILLGWHFRAAFQALAAAHKLGLKVLARSDSHLRSFRPPWRTHAREVSHRVLLRRFDGCLAVGSWSRDYFLHFGVPEEHVFVVPHSVDSERFRPVPGVERVDSIRRSIVRFGFVGRLVEGKGVEVVIEASALLAREGFDLELVVAGDGPALSSLRELARGAEAPARFVGFVNQAGMPDFLRQLDCLVLPSYSETWGIVVNEALACGVPSIVSHLVGCSGDFRPPAVLVAEAGVVSAWRDRMRTFIQCDRARSREAAVLAAEAARPEETARLLAFAVRSTCLGGARVGR